MKNRMGSGGERLQNQRGMVLFTSLAILTVLVAVGIGIRVMLQNDYKILSNLRGSTEAFYVSVAGLEWSKDEIAQTASFPPAPVNRVKNFAAGEFAVSFLSPTVVSPLAAKLVVRSVGAIGSSSHALQAQLTKTYDLADAAIALRGNASRVSFSGNSVFISGADHDPSTGNAVTGAKARYAISTSDDTLRGVVQTLGDPPPESILDSNSAAPGVAASGFLPASTISQLANDLCGSSTAFVSVIPSGGSLIVENQTWGSQTAPQLRCIEGLPTAGDGATLNGTISGAGILIIKDAELILTGSFHWEGLIIITGGEVALKVLGSSSKEIFGAVIVNESGSPGSTSAILDIQGNLRLLYSRQGLTRAAGLVPTATLGNIYAVLPSAVSQQYWRAVSP